MQVILGIDIGTSTTKTAVLDAGRSVLALQRNSSGEPKAVCESMIREMAAQGKFDLKDVSKIMLTGVGASFIEENIPNSFFPKHF